MAKKKLSLKPVQRSIATTSVASKKPEKTSETTNTEEESQPEESQPAPGNRTKPTDVSSSQTDAAGGIPEKEAWEDETTAEQLELQGIVDRLQGRSDRDVTRIIKALEFDTRLSKSFQRLEPLKEVRDEILSLALEEEQAAPKNARSGPIGDKELQSTYIAYKIVSYLGFSEDRVWQCLREVCPSGDWEDCIEWMWLHCSEDECLSRGEFARKEVEPSQIDAPLLVK